MALFNAMIQRPGGSPHRVEERPDTRHGRTYLWCDCPGWRFRASKGGCVHVRMAREMIEGGHTENEAPAPVEAPTAPGVPIPVSVMLASKVDAPRGRISEDGTDDDGESFRLLTRSDLAFEPKWDGHRTVVEVRDGVARLWARSQREVTADWPELLDQWASLSGVFDGEIIALGATDTHTFNALQNVGSMTVDERANRIRLVLWDVLEHDGIDLHDKPYTVRRMLLDDLRRSMGERIVLTPNSRDGVALWNSAIDQGLEGVIAKPLGSTYKYGERGTWMKLKALQSLELVVVGYTSGKADHGKVDTPFGALVLAERQQNGVLTYAGKVGTGFTAAATRELLATLQPFETPDPPWSNRGVIKRVRSHVGSRRLTWVLPVVTVTVEFQERNNDGMPRFPAWKGIAHVEASKG